MFAKAFGAVSAAANTVTAVVKEQTATVSCPGGCGQSCPKAMESLKFLNPCLTCSKNFCSKCVTLLANTHDDQFVGAKGGGASAEAGSFEGKYVCNKHRDEVFRDLKNRFCEASQAEVRRGTSEYLGNDERQVLVYKKPFYEKGSKGKLSLAKDLIVDSTYGIASVLGFKDVVKLAYNVYLAGGIYQFIMDPALYALIQPIVQRMEEDATADRKAANIAETKKTKSEHAQEFIDQVVHLYYLSLVHKHKNMQEIAGTVASTASEGVIAQCPVELIDTLGEYLGAAKWLYFALSSIHREDSMKWYLSKIIWSEGWTVLSATNQSITFVDGQKNPAFCVAARKSTLKGKEVIVSIRGSSEKSDWWINANESPQKMIFEGVDGYVHGGMYEGVLAILDNFGARAQIMELVKLGYKVTVVGHSLGAGTAMLLAMELLNYMRKVNIPNAEKIVKAVTYATPAVVTENLADRIASLGWITAVYDNDVVPRISHGNIKKLTTELKEFSPTAKQWFESDYKSLKENITDFGERVTNTPTVSEDSQADSEPQPAVFEFAHTSSPPSDLLLVPPGRIVHITRKSASVGGYLASEISHRNPCLRSIKLITDQMVDDHLLDNYFSAIKGARFTPAYGPCPINDAAAAQPIAPDLSKPVSCGICDLDTTWPCRTHNSSSRYDYTQYCVLCKKTVCVVCAPAKDLVPEEGLSKDYKTLSDLRMPVLSKGIPLTSRVCINCYLSSYKMI